MRVPSQRLWGAQTQRSVDNFKIGVEERIPIRVIKSMAVVKLAAARVNMLAGKLNKDIGSAIVTASQEVIDGTHDEQFPLVVW